jgi:hypothetical protein
MLELLLEAQVKMFFKRQFNIQVQFEEKSNIWSQRFGSHQNTGGPGAKELKGITKGEHTEMEERVSSLVPSNL